MPELSIPALDGRSKAERVADAIEEQIRGLELRPGAFLGTKATLRQQLRISPATLDTALGVLSDRGLVELKPGAKGGVRVADPAAAPSVFMGRARWPVRGDGSEAARAGQASALYLALQPHVVARAVPAATAADRAALTAARDTLRACGEDPEGYQQAHLTLHQALLDASHDDVLALVVRSLMDIMDVTTGPPQPPAGEVAAWIEERVSVHVAVVDAVLEGDLMAAWGALSQHGLTPEDLDAGGLVLPPGATALEEAWRRAVR